MCWFTVMAYWDTHWGKAIVNEICFTCAFHAITCLHFYPEKVIKGNQNTGFCFLSRYISSFYSLPSIRLYRPRLVMTASCPSTVRPLERFWVTYTLRNNLQDFLGVGLIWNSDGENKPYYHVLLLPHYCANRIPLTTFHPVELWLICSKGQQCSLIQLPLCKFSLHFVMYMMYIPTAFQRVVHMKTFFTFEQSYIQVGSGIIL